MKSKKKILTIDEWNKLPENEKSNYSDLIRLTPYYLCPHCKERAFTRIDEDWNYPFPEDIKDKEEYVDDKTYWYCKKCEIPLKYKDVIEEA